jgi:hypothetical protein
MTANHIITGLFGKRTPAAAGQESSPMVCERKFAGPVELLDAALALLAHHSLPDPDFPAGTIESIYFDDEVLSAYWEKANGDMFKRKVRLRWYPEGALPAAGPIAAFLEIKGRFGAARDKRHLRFTADGALLGGAPLHAPALSRLLYAQSAALSLPAGLTPTISIRYHRHRFVCPLSGARICLDSEIHSARVNTNRFPDSGRLDADGLVCEIKDAQRRPTTWSGDLFRLGFRARSVSKYGLFMEKRMV